MGVGHADTQPAADESWFGSRKAETAAAVRIGDSCLAGFFGKKEGIES